MKNVYKANDESIKKAAEIIKSGGVIAIPTDTVYGLSAGIKHPEAIKRIYKIKNRPENQPLITHIADLEDLAELTEITDTVKKLAAKFWPGALTLVFTPELSIRIPDNQTDLEIIRLAETPIVSTSANLSGYPNPLTAEKVYEQIGDKVDMILDSGKCSLGIPSTLLDISQTPAKIIRLGAISEKELMEFL